MTSILRRRCNLVDPGIVGECQSGRCPIRRLERGPDHRGFAEPVMLGGAKAAATA
jgi:hypothetical protein